MRRGKWHGGTRAPVLLRCLLIDLCLTANPLAGELFWGWEFARVEERMALKPQICNILLPTFAPCPGEWQNDQNVSKGFKRIQKELNCELFGLRSNISNLRSHRTWISCDFFCLLTVASSFNFRPPSFCEGSCLCCFLLKGTRNVANSRFGQCGIVHCTVSGISTARLPSLESNTK